jgi:hypothetical protein
MDRVVRLLVLVLSMFAWAMLPGLAQGRMSFDMSSN